MDEMNYNVSLEQFCQHFATEEACAEYLFQTKWPNGFVCPRCGHQHAYVTGTRRLALYECRHCRHQTSLTAGTILEGSRTDLRKWLIAMFLVSRPADQGINAVELSKIIQVTYKTAWLILHKIRKMISEADQSALLSGIVRINSAIYGKPYNPSIRKHPQEHYFLIGSSLNEHGESNYLKMKLISESNIHNSVILRSEDDAFIKKHVEPQTSDVQIITGRYSPKRFRSLLAIAAQAGKWINKNFHGIGHKYLQNYLDEFSYRLNLSIRTESAFSHLTRICFSASPSVSQIAKIAS